MWRRTTLATQTATEPGAELDPGVAEAFARLIVATRFGDRQAAARIIDRLALTDQGGWLVRQFCAAGMRKAAEELGGP